MRPDLFYGGVDTRNQLDTGIVNKLNFMNVDVRKANSDAISIIKMGKVNDLDGTTANLLCLAYIMAICLNLSSMLYMALFK